jgi:resuscitation-promoting factor RpfB
MSALRRTLVAISAVLVVGGAAFYLASSAVAVVVDGVRLTTRTFAHDVAGVLAGLDVVVGHADRVEPAADTPVEDGLRIVVTRAKTVEVQVDDDGPQRVTAVADTVADVLAAGGLADLLAREARVDPAPDARVADGDRITVRLPRAVTIAVDGHQRQVAAYAATVAEALSDAGIAVGESDLVDPARDHALQGSTLITVQRVETVVETIEVAIAHGEERQETEELISGETRAHANGEDGLRRETYEVTLVDGQETARELVADEVVRVPVDRVVLVGVGPGPVREAQQLLADLGYPVGPVDGIDGPQTRRALCAWRSLEGHGASRAGLQPGDIEALRETSGLPAADAGGRGVTVDRTCQVLYYRQDGRWQHVHQASTGADGLPQPGSYSIQRTRAGWHTSTLYPAPQPNMYNSLYIRGAIAIHGSNHVPPHPASAGCVRVTPETADHLFARLRIGDPVQVIGAY